MEFIGLGRLLVGQSITYAKRSCPSAHVRTRVARRRSDLDRHRRCNPWAEYLLRRAEPGRMWFLTLLPRFL